MNIESVADGINTLFGGERVELVSPLPPDECVKRLLEATASGGTYEFSSLLKPDVVVGRIDGFKINLHKRIFYRNGFQTYLTADLRSHDTGTVIQGKLGMDVLTQVFVILLFGFFAITGSVVFMWSAVVALANSSQMEMNFLKFFLMPAAILIAAGVGRCFAGNEGELLKGFLRQTLDVPLKE